jgi:hypothetical protein
MSLKRQLHLFVGGLSVILAAGLPGRAQVQNVTDTTSTPVPGVGHDYLGMLNETVEPANGAVSLHRYQAGRDFGNSMSVFPRGTDPFYNLQLLYLLANQQRQKPPRACTTIQGPNGPETNCVD